MDQLKIAMELWKSGERNFHENMFIAATVDYSKAVFAAIDYAIIKKLGIKPDSHEKRFNIVFYRFRGIYPFLKLVYDRYRDAYSRVISKEEALEVRKNAEKIFKELGILEEITKE